MAGELDQGEIKWHVIQYRVCHTNVQYDFGCRAGIQPRLLRGKKNPRISPRVGSRLVVGLVVSLVLVFVVHCSRTSTSYRH